MSCSDDMVPPVEMGGSPLTRSVVEEADSTVRLAFSDELALSEAISSMQDGIEGLSVTSAQKVQSSTPSNPQFISMMAMQPVSADVTQPRLTYYEALGYDSLVPNPKFAQLLNTRGEVEVGNEIIADKVLVTAMVDRLTHKALLLNMTGKSYRMKETHDLISQQI